MKIEVKIPKNKDECKAIPALDATENASGVVVDPPKLLNINTLLMYGPSLIIQIREIVPHHIRNA